MTAQLPEELQPLAGLMQSWEWSPYKFARDIIPWGREGTVYGTWKRMHPWHEDVLRELDALLEQRRAANPEGYIRQIGVLMASGHGTGKTEFMIPVLVGWALLTKPFSRGIISAGSEDQLKNVTWKGLSELFKVSPILSRYFATTERYISQKDRTEDMRAGGRPTWGVVGMTPSPENRERMFGLHSNSCTIFVFDESEAVHDLLYSAVDGTMTDPFALHISAGNPVRRSGWFAN